jgi:DNA modification methylase
MNKLICGDSAVELKKLITESVDLTVTSPPYDNIRQYSGYSFDFETIARELFRVTKHGGVVVWVIGDGIKDGDNSGTSFKQALYFKEIGFNLYDVIIYAKNNITFPHKNRYHKAFEYMFILSKGKPKTVNLIEDRKNKYGGTHTWGNMTQREPDGTLTNKGQKYIKEYGVRYNIWNYTVGKGNVTKDKIAYKHPAIFPERLAHDHIVSWSNEGDLVLDPFCGSGTTCKMAKQLHRDYIGIDISEEYLEITRKRLA